MNLLIEKLEINSTDKEYKKFEQLITVVSIAYLKTAIYTYHAHSKKPDFSVSSKFDYLMNLYNQLLREHQVMFLLFNTFEIAIRTKAAYELSKKYSTPDTDDWLHNGEKTPDDIKPPLKKPKENISKDTKDIRELSTFEIFDYIMFGDMISIYIAFWNDLKHLFEKKTYKGHQLREIGKKKLIEMLHEIRKARNDNAHHKPLHKKRKQRSKLIEDIESILLHIGFNLDEAINNIDPHHKIIKIGYYENINKVKNLLLHPSKENFNEIQELFQYKGLNHYFQKELLKSDLIAWYNVFKTLNHFEKSNFPCPNQEKYLNFWNELNFLEQISRNFEDEKYKEIEREFIDIVNEIIDYFAELASQGNSMHSHNDWILFTIIQNFASASLNMKHLTFIEQSIKRDRQYSLVASGINKSFLEKVFQCDDSMVLEFFRILFSYEISDEQYSNEFQSLMQDYSLREIVENSLTLMSAMQAAVINEFLLKQLSKMDKESELDTFYIASIEPSDQRQDYDQSISIILVDCIRDLFEMQNASEIIDDVKIMLSSESSIQKRLAIHLINKFFHEMKNLFFEHEKNLLDDSGLSHEIYMLFERHANDFTESEIDKVIELIENQDFSYFEEIEDNAQYGERRKAHRKRKYFYALKDSVKHSKLLDLFNKYNSMLEHEDEHPAFDSYVSSVQTIGYTSPLTVEEIKNMTTKELIEYIQDGFQEDKRKLNRATHGSLAAQIGAIILNEPDYYIDELNNFAQLNEEYFYRVVDAYKQILQQKKQVDLKKLLDFILLFINLHKADKDFKHWYISHPISKFIEELSSVERNYVIDNELHNLIMEIFLKTDSFINDYEEKDEVKDYISHMLNAPKGQLYSAMIIYSLKYARDNKLEQSRWIEEIMSLFSYKISHDKSVDIYTVIGKYLPNISYLNESWRQEHFELVFGKDVPDKFWEASFSGYLYNSTMYLKLYDEMLNIGALERALKFPFKRKEANRKLIEFICISYNSENEVLGNELSVIFKLIDNASTEQLETIIRFFQSRINEQKFDVEKIVKPLWKKVLIQVKEKKYTKLHKELLQLISSVDKIDKEIYELLLESIEELEKFDGYYPWIVDNFLRLLEENTKYVADIYIALLKKYYFSSYEKDKDKEIVEYLYKHNFKTEANKICTLYGEYGDNSFEDIYNQYK
ncbi:MAG: Abi family protein [Sulfurimonas sp.]